MLRGRVHSGVRRLLREPVQKREIFSGGTTRVWSFSFGTAALICCVTLIVTLSTAVSVESAPHTLSTILQCRFDPDGYFYIKGDPPGGFKEIDYIKLLVGAKQDGPPFSGSRLSVRGGKFYKFTKLGEFRTHMSGGGINFDFETESAEGISYKFTGKFRSICVLAEEKRDPERVVAAGRLTKLVEGQEAATVEVHFTYSQSRRRRAEPLIQPERERACLSSLTYSSRRCVRARFIRALYVSRCN